MECISLLSRLLKVDIKNWSWAGTKDKRGITTQKVSVHKVNADRLAGLNRTLNGIRLGDFSYSTER